MQVPSHLCARGYVAFLSPSPVQLVFSPWESWSWAGKESHPVELRAPHIFCVKHRAVSVVGDVGKSRCEGDYGRDFFTRVCAHVRPGRQGWGLWGTLSLAPSLH